MRRVFEREVVEGLMVAFLKGRVGCLEMEGVERD